MHSRGDPTSGLQTQGEGREPQHSPARPPRHPPPQPRPGPRRALTPAGRARSGSRAGVRTRVAPAAPGPRRRSEASAWLQVLWRALGTAAASGVHRTTFLSPAKSVGAARTWRASAGAERTEGAGWTSRGAEPARPGPWEEPIGEAETRERSPGTETAGPCYSRGCENLKTDRP